MKNILAVCCLFLICMTSFTSAIEIGGVTLSDTMKLEKTTLKLNGVGLRKKVFVKVYAGGLYLESNQSQADTIISADEPMAIRMHFIYDGVSSDKLISAWNDGFAKSTSGSTGSIQKQIDQFNGFYTETAEKNHVHDLIYEPGKGVTVILNGKTVGIIPGLDFKKALFGIWLCDEPADKGLKNGMLGK